MMEQDDYLRNLIGISLFLSIGIIKISYAKAVQKLNLTGSLPSKILCSNWEDRNI